MLLIGVGLGAICLLLASRPPRTDLTQELFQGITYLRQARTTPRPLVIHAVTIDLTAPGIGFLVTPREAACALDVCALTTGEFLEKYGLQVAVNGSFFEPFRSADYTLADYYPHTHDPVDIRGLTISNGELYSAAEAAYANLCLTPALAHIVQGACPAETTQALAGREILVAAGEVVDHSADTGLHPRTAIAISDAGRTLWLIVVDGRQGGYSEGVTVNELASIVQAFGVTTALNMDGGGSSTLVIARGGTQLLNSPIHTRIPLRQRPVGNHLGIYALPLTPP